MITIDSDGTITLYQGDSGELVISGFDNTKKYTVYFAIQDKKRKFVGKELQVSVNNSDTATFVSSLIFMKFLSWVNNIANYYTINKIKNQYIIKIFFNLIIFALQS